MKCTNKIVLLIMTTVSALFMTAWGYKTDTEVPKVTGEMEQTEETIKGANEYYEDGLTYLYGLNGSEINLEMAYANFVKARELGVKKASFYLGLLYDWYCYPKEDFQLAKVYYEENIDNPSAQVALGFMYQYGQGVEVDKKKAKTLFQTVVNAGYADGYYGIGAIEADSGNHTKAFDYYNKALAGTEQCYKMWIMDNLGDMYRYGVGVKQDCTKAVEWYSMSASLGNGSAMNKIGYMYQYGEGVELNYQTAILWYQMSATLWDSIAMNNIGYMYERGEGVEQNYTKAMEWYVKSASLGNTSAMNNIGFLYVNGNGVKQDYAKAVEWIQKAADLGDKSAMGNLAYMYENGLGVKQDLSKATEWNYKAGNGLVLYRTQ